MDQNKEFFERLEDKLKELEKRREQAEKDLEEEKEKGVQLRIYLEVLDELKNRNSVVNGKYKVVDLPHNYRVNQENIINNVYKIINC